MTVAELYNQVAQLGFEDTLENQNRFYYALDRAIYQAGLLRPRYASVEIHHYPAVSVADVCDHVAHAKIGAELIYTAPWARSYYFECDGTGNCVIEAFVSGAWTQIGEVLLTGSVSGVYKSYSGFIKRDNAFTELPVRLRFVGEFFYAVRNLALYQTLYSDRISDIPVFSPFSSYDISSLCTDFISFASPPISGEDGIKLGNEYTVEDGRVLLLPRTACGDYKVIYRRKPKPVSRDYDAEENEEVIDLDEEICTLLPLLVASYIWLDDEPEISARYMDMYRERAAEITRAAFDAAPVFVRSCNNW